MFRRRFATPVDTRKKEAGERRREESQLRMLLEREVQRERACQTEVEGYERQIEQLARQYSAALEAQRLEAQRARDELAAWQARLHAVTEVNRQRYETLGALKEREAILMRALDEHRVTLAACFIPRDTTLMDPQSRINT